MFPSCRLQNCTRAFLGVCASLCSKYTTDIKNWIALLCKVMTKKWNNEYPCSNLLLAWFKGIIINTLQKHVYKKAEISNRKNNLLVIWILLPQWQIFRTALAARMGGSYHPCVGMYVWTETCTSLLFIEGNPRRGLIMDFQPVFTFTRSTVTWLPRLPTVYIHER